jgi:hypothetical protein
MLEGLFDERVCFLDYNLKIAQNVPLFLNKSTKYQNQVRHVHTFNRCPSSTATFIAGLKQPLCCKYFPGHDLTPKFKVHM